MAALLREILDVCLLRRGPQDLPYSPPAVMSFAVVLVVMQMAFAAYHDMPPAALASRAVVTLLMLFGVTVGLLRLRKLDNRAAQTLLALVGAEVLFALISMPMLVVVQPHMGSENPPGSALVVMLAAVFTFFWKLRVNAAIWRQALEIPGPAATLLTLGLLLCEALLLFALVPPAVPAAP